jgi:hypothetical protein
MIKEVMFLFGTGFKGLQSIQFTKSTFLAMVLYRTSTQFCAWNLHFKRKKHACCWKVHLDLLLRIMENILYILMEVHGMMKHIMSWDWNTIYTYHFRKVWWKESTSILRTELKILMITIHVCKMNAIYFMYITGYNSLFLCIMRQ